MEALRILLIEPDRYARDLLRLLVESAYPGVVVTTVRTAADGIEMCQWAQYDIVICDDSPWAAPLKEICIDVHCCLVLMPLDTRLKPSDLQPLHPNLPAQSLLYKPIMFSDFFRNLHRAVYTSRCRQAKTSRRRCGRVLQPRGN